MSTDGNLELTGLLSERWSPSAFSDRPVTARELRQLLNAARWAASSYNEQPWRFLVERKLEDPDGYAKLLGCLIEINRNWAQNAPVLMLTAGKKTFSHNGRPNRFGLHDAGMALANLMIQATAMGLHVHAMGGFDQEKARAAFAVPDDYELGAAVAIGFTERERPDTRQRKPFEEFAFSGTWGHAVKL